MHIINSIFCKYRSLLAIYPELGNMHTSLYHSPLCYSCVAVCMATHVRVQVHMLAHMKVRAGH